MPNYQALYTLLCKKADEALCELDELALAHAKAAEKARRARDILQSALHAAEDAYTSDNKPPICLVEKQDAPQK